MNSKLLICVNVSKVHEIIFLVLRVLKNDISNWNNNMNKIHRPHCDPFLTKLQSLDEIVPEEPVHCELCLTREVELESHFSILGTTNQIPSTFSVLWLEAEISETVISEIGQIKQSYLHSSIKLQALSEIPPKWYLFIFNATVFHSWRRQHKRRLGFLFPTDMTMLVSFDLIRYLHINAERIMVKKH